MQQFFAGDVEQAHLDTVIFDRVEVVDLRVEHDAGLELLDFLFDFGHISHNWKQYNTATEKRKPKK